MKSLLFFALGISASLAWSFSDFLVMPKAFANSSPRSRLEKIEVEDGIGYVKDPKTGLCIFTIITSLAAIDCKYFDMAKK